jgi:hypothetical protein
MSGIMRHNFLPVIVEGRRINNGDIKPWRFNLPIGRTVRRKVSTHGHLMKEQTGTHQVCCYIIIHRTRVKECERSHKKN